MRTYTAEQGRARIPSWIYADGFVERTISEEDPLRVLEYALITGDKVLVTLVAYQAMTELKCMWHPLTHNDLLSASRRCREGGRCSSLRKIYEIVGYRFAQGGLPEKHPP